MTGKQVVIDMSETIKEKSGKDLEQWFFRIVIMYLLFGEDAIGMMPILIPKPEIPNPAKEKK